MNWLQRALCLLVIKILHLVWMRLQTSTESQKTRTPDIIPDNVVHRLLMHSLPCRIRPAITQALWHHCQIIIAVLMVHRQTTITVHVVVHQLQLVISLQLLGPLL